ncbi:hypothetical protein ACFYN3_41360 [Streptomyces lavendulae]|uniref:hypothetical protein n=1 Tax=Streptomyces lavendulae TaxID=1914 RepID=UPI0036857CE1
MQSLPGIGHVRARRHLIDLGISETRRIQGLGERQSERLVKLFSPRDRTAVRPLLGLAVRRAAGRPLPRLWPTSSRWWERKGSPLTYGCAPPCSPIRWPSEGRRTARTAVGDGPPCGWPDVRPVSAG